MSYLNDIAQLPLWALTFSPQIHLILKHKRIKGIFVLVGLWRVSVRKYIQFYHDLVPVHVHSLDKEIDKLLFGLKRSRGNRLFALSIRGI